MAIWNRRNLVLDGSPFSFSGHEYLREIYESQHEYTVIEKASQMGASVYALSKSIWACETRGMTVIYFFPTESDVQDFSRDRFERIVNESPHVASLIDTKSGGGRKQLDNVKLKRVGQGSLYFRGLFYSAKARQGRSGIRTKSVDADFLIFDELDEAQPKQKEAAKHRVDHSKWKWILELSTPTIPDYGIDVEFKRSDQRFWTLKCPHCGEWNCVEDEFPKCLVKTGEETAILACKKCRKSLDPESGEWVSKYPSRAKRRGYHLCQLYSKFIDINDILNEYEDPKTDITLFYNHRLGLPHVDSNDRIQVEEVLACCRNELTFPGQAYRCSMGVDQGKNLHVVITARHQSGKQQVVYLDVLDDFDQLEHLIKRFDVHTCVIDALPNQHSARRFAAKHPRRVYLCYYSDHQKGAYHWTDDPDNSGNSRVEVNRTESLDATFREMRQMEILLPRRERVIEEFAQHCFNLVRTKEEDPETGVINFKYVRVGDDHFAHARNYCRIAESRNAGKPVRAVTIGKRNDWRQLQ